MLVHYFSAGIICHNCWSYFLLLLYCCRCSIFKIIILVLAFILGTKTIHGWKLYKQLNERVYVCVDACVRLYEWMLLGFWCCRCNIMKTTIMTMMTTFTIKSMTIVFSFFSRLNVENLYTSCTEVVNITTDVSFLLI